jgi:hypothetical protein
MVLIMEKTEIDGVKLSFDYINFSKRMFDEVVEPNEEFLNPLRVGMIDHRLSKAIEIILKETILDKSKRLDGESFKVAIDNYVKKCEHKIVVELLKHGCLV